MMKRKNLAKGFAIAGCALCLPLALVGCGDPSIVDTSGNYSTELDTAQISEYVQQVANIAESTKSYQFRCVYDVRTDEGKGRIEGEGNFNFETGEIAVDTSISLSAEGQQIDYSGSVYYDGLYSFYEQEEDEGWTLVKNEIVASQLDMFQAYCSFDIIEDFIGPVDDVTGAKAEKNGEVRIKISTVEEPQYDVYLVFDQEGFFKGLKVDFDYSAEQGSQTITIEWLASEEAVESPIETPVE